MTEIEDRTDEAKRPELTEQQKADAYRKVENAVASQASDLSQTDQEEVLYRALEKYWKGLSASTAVSYAVADVTRKNSAGVRRHRIVEANSDRLDAAIERQAGGQVATLEDVLIAQERRHRFHAADERILQETVLEHCQSEYQKSWGKPWEGAAALRAPDLLDADQLHAKEEHEARSLLKSVQVARLSDVAPDVGGAGVRLLWEVQQLVGKREPGQLSEGFLDRSELRRFVNRARCNPAVMVMLGCTRRPASEPSDSRPNPRWVTRPNEEELTIICLLAGFWPEIRTWPTSGMTVRELVTQRMRRTVAAAIKDVGHHPYESTK